ncbi:hypothetical protein ES705_49256 [subsurface metagenome]
MVDYQQHISALLTSVKTKKNPQVRKPYRKPEAVQELERVYHDRKLRTSRLPANAILRTTFEDRTSNGLTACIIAHIKLKDGSAYRINSQGQYDTKLKRWRYSGMRKGVPDIQAVVNGQYLGIEVKVGRDQQSEYQRKVQAEIEASGGQYYLARNFTDFRAWFENVKKINETAKYCS